jgi:glycerophosphoryl diester phosphodiesterase
MNMKKTALIAALSLLAIAASAQPKVVGHRGCRFEGPYENTIASFSFAQEAGVDAVEYDVHLTSDDKVIVFHGPSVPGTDGKDVRKMTFAEARKVVLPGGHRMPSLEEWFAQARKAPQIKIIMELKAQLSKERETLLVEKAMSMVKSSGMESQVEYTTFSEWMCKEIHRVDPKAKVIFISSGVFVPDAAYAKEKGYDGISYNLDGFLNNPHIAKQAKELGIETTLWLVNDYEVADWAILHDIDCISTDHPEKLVPYIKAVKDYRK